MAIEKVVNINIKDNANDVEKDINSLNQAGKKLDNTFKDVNATFEDVYGELKPLTARLGEAEDRLYELALAGKQNTQEYKELLKATANYRQVQIQTDLVVDSAAQTMSQKLGGALEGAASGFALVQGAMGLFGSESEEVEKALLKVQSAMALAQGIEGVRTALPVFKSFGLLIKNGVANAFKSLKSAIISTGIGALVVALGMAADAMGLFESSTDDASKANKRLADSIKNTSDEIDRVVNRRKKQLDQQIAEAKAYGATERELFEMRKQQIDAEEKLQQATYENNKKRIAKLSKSKSDEVKAEVENLKKQNSAIYKTLYDRIDGENDYDIQRRDLEIEYTAFVNKEQEERSKEEEEKKNKSIERANERKKQLIEIERQRLINLQNLEREFLAEIEQVENEYYDSKLSQEEQEVRKVEDKYFNLLNKAQEYNDSLTEKEQNKRINTVTLEEARLSEIANIEKEYRDKKLEEEKKLKDEQDKLDDERKQKFLQTEQAKRQLTYETFSAINGIISAFAGANEKQQRKAFEMQKAVSIAQTIIDTYKGAQAIFASAAANPSTILFPAQPFITAGLAVASGLANVKKIASTQFNGGSGSVGSPSVPNVAGNTSTQQLSTPNFNVVGASGISQTENLKPVKAYVVSGEVTSAQSLDRNRIQNATF